jgi:hypothetical protein
MCAGEGTVPIFDVHNNNVIQQAQAIDQNELAPTSAPTWMDGFSFLSL